MVGWSLFAYAVGSTSQLERDLRTQVSDIWNDRARIIEERNRLRAEVGELQQAQAQLTARIQAAAAQPAPEPVRASALGQETVVEQGEADAASVTGTVLSPAEVKASIRTAQMVLTELGFGPLKADGAMGARTRRALRAFERRNGLPETGQLGPRTVQALKGAVDFASRPAGDIASGRASADARP
jgi:hypothetical protein